MVTVFELFVAWRYLTETARGSRRMVLYVGLGLLGLAAVTFVIASQIPPLDPGEIYEGKRSIRTLFQQIGAGILVAGEWVTVFGFLYSFQSGFTTISAFCVHLGTAALVIVLSVMNGFEVDLRQKILGSNAHILVTKEDGAFTDWREIEKKLDGVCARDVCVVAHTPYVTSEVVVAANSNHNGVIIKGIDPETVAAVTDLRKNLQQGDALQRLWPVLGDGGVGRYTSASSAPDAGAPDAGGPEEDQEPPDFSGGAPAEEEDTEPIDFSKPRPAPVVIDPFDTDHPRHRPLRPDPRVQSLDGILVGRELAKNLHLYVGQEVLVVSPLGQDTPAGQVPRTRPFRVSGMFYSGMYEYDTKFVYVSLPALQRFLSIGDEVTGIEIKISDMDETEGIVRALSQRLGAGYRVQDWKQINRNLFSALKLEKIAMFSILANIIVVACLSIILNLIMVVVEKGREIAILKSMGATHMSVMGVFVIEGLYIGGIGTILGIVIGVGVCFAVQTVGIPLDPNVYYINKLPIAMDPFAIAMVAVAGVCISVMSTIYPSWVAAKMRPVDGLRYQ